MSKHDYPQAATVASLLNAERRTVSWGKQGIEFAHQNLLVAAKDIPEGEEYAELRRAVYRALDKLRQARGALTAAYDTTIEAMLIAERSEAVYIRNERLKERYSGSRGRNGAEMVRGARKARDRREEEYAAWERRKRERERKEFLVEGMRENTD
jgi:hypothetical protein